MKYLNKRIFRWSSHVRVWFCAIKCSFFARPFIGPQLEAQVTWSFPGLSLVLPPPPCLVRKNRYLPLLYADTHCTVHPMSVLYCTVLYWVVTVHPLSSNLWSFGLSCSGSTMLPDITVKTNSEGLTHQAQTQDSYLRQLTHSIYKAGVVLAPVSRLLTPLGRGSGLILT